MRRAALAAAVLAMTAAAALPGQAMAASETCTAPPASGIDGYVLNDYYKLTAQRDPSDSRTTWVCYRVFFRHNQTVDRGGRIDVTNATVSPTLPGSDDQGAACTTTAGNAFPGPRPLLAGQIGDPGDPQYFPFLVDAYLGGGNVWACLQAGALSRRVTASVNGIALPRVTLLNDAPGQPLPPQQPGPAGYPSSKCYENAWHVRDVNMQIQDAHVYVYHWPESATQTAVCVRVERPGVKPIGYRVVLDTDTSGVVPVVEQSDTDLTPCTETIAAVSSPQPVRLSMSSGVTPASVCVDAPGLITHRWTAGTNGNPRVPLPTIYKDPDSA